MTQFNKLSYDYIETRLQEQTHYFCYFDIRNYEELLTVIILASALIIVFVVALKKYYQIWRVVINKTIRKIFGGIFTWWVTYLIKDLFSIVLYITYSSQQNQDDSNLSYLSKIMFSVDWFSAFIMQSLLIYVCYQWMKKISQTFSMTQGGQSEAGSRVQQDSFIGTGYTGVQSKLYPKVNIYLKVRAVSFILLIVFLALTDFNTISLISKILLGLLLCDSLIIMIILTAGIYSLKTNPTLKQQIDEDQSTRLKNQYLIMILCSLFRFSLDLYLLIYSTGQNLTDDSCKFGVQLNWIDLLIQVLTALLGHYLPVLIILRIYTLQQKPQDLSKSLLIAANTSN